VGSLLAGTPAVLTGAAGAGPVTVPVPYIKVPVSWMTPGASVTPCTVIWWPAVSVSLTVNGPGPAPDGASQ
jgi:hypothetical protein